MYEFMGEENQLMPFGDPDYDDSDDERSGRKSRRRKGKSMKEVEMFSHSEDEDDIYVE